MLPQDIFKPIFNNCNNMFIFWKTAKIKKDDNIGWFLKVLGQISNMYLFTI